MDAPTLRPGTRLAHYEVLSTLGTGGMGTVYEAHDTALDRLVALKVLNPALAADAAVVERFEREARAAARRNHPNLAHIYYVGSVDGLHFFAMEHVPGVNLEDLVAKEGPQPLGRVVDAVVQAANGLAAAHRAGIVHRDVKPSNIMVQPDGSVKVTDFGLAKSIEGDPSVTGDGRIMGTPLYMSPETCRERPADTRSDVYSLGLTAWFLLAGRPPFVARSIAETMIAQIERPLPSVRQFRPELPAEVDRVLGRMCAKDPAARPQTMEEVAALWEAVRPRPLHPAPIAARAAALSIDLLCVGTVEAAAIFSVRETFGSETLRGWIDEITLTVAAFVFLLFVEARWDVSLGKSALNLRVLRADGTAPSLRDHLVRFVCRFPVLLIPTPPQYDIVFYAAWGLQAAAFGLGALWWFASGGTTLSDRITGTRVVYRLPSVNVPGGAPRPPG